MGTEIEWSIGVSAWRRAAAGQFTNLFVFLRGAGHEFQTLLLISEAFHPYLNEVLIGKHR